MEMIKKKRTLLRTSVTRSVKEIEKELEKECPSSEAIRASYRILENKGKRLGEVDAQVENIMLADESVTSHDWDKEKQMVEQYEKSLVVTEIKVNEYLKAREIRHKITGEWDSAKTGQDGLAACRLPKISLAIYDGTYLDWLGWWSQFETIHENPGISEVDKFRYLMQSIKQGTRAERLVRSYPLTKENYPKVIKALKDRFGDSTILTEVYVRQLLKLVVNSVRRKSLFLESMYDQLESHLKSLESLGVNIQQNAYLLYPMVESSLPEDLLRTRQKSALAGYDVEDGELPPTVDKRLTSLLEFMRREVKDELRLGYIRYGLGESSRMRTNGHYVTKMHAAEVKSKTEKVDPHCIICQGGHWIQRCPKWCAMPNTRLEDKVDQVNEQELAYTGMHVRTAIPKTLLATALVRIMNNRGERMIGIPDTTRLDNTSSGVCVNKMTGMLPRQDLCLSIPASWHSLPLADPQFERSRKIDMILGADVYGQSLLPDIKRQRQGQLCAQNTRLGWVISGKLPLVDQSSPHLVYHTSVKYEDSLEDILKRFWEVEEIPIKRRSSAEEEFCEQLYQSEIKRSRTVRYVVPLPLDPTIAESDLFGLSVAVCFRRQLAMERRLDRDVYLKGEYCSFMKNYEELGHMTPLPEKAARDVEGFCFLSHHAVRVTQPAKKLRVVFDAATKTTNGFLLNDRLYAGLKLQNDISSVLLRWRLPKIVMVADIEKMYRQILVRPQDALRQRILWRQNARETMRPYQLNTVTYGTSPAPFLALRELIQLAKDDGHLYPKAAEAIRRDTYVDDILTGAENSIEAMGIQRELIDLLRGEVKTLGLGWDPKEDSFVYAISDPSNTEEFTKRQMLSFIAKQYDPMGWLAPLMIVGNILIQRLWITGTTWDEPLDDSIKIIWQRFKKDMGYIRITKIPRWLGASRSDKVQIHGFCDASGDAYAAAIYLKVLKGDGSRVELVIAKTRLAPIRRMSIPRLELCAAVLLTRLVIQIMPSLEIDIESITCWTDATIVLRWIKTLSRTLPTFVGNRVSEIQACRKIKQWRHVPSKDNPADIAFRGTMSSGLRDSQLWWKGPTWLAASPELWPEMPNIQAHCDETEALISSMSDQPSMLVVLGRRCSSLIRYQRVVAWIMRFGKNCRARDEQVRSYLTLDELREAQKKIVLAVQSHYFGEELKSLKDRDIVKRSSPIYALNPFLDIDGVIRVGGKIAQMIIQEVHARTLHGGVHLMLSTLRQKYWMPRVKYQLKKCIRECHTCCRYNRITQNQLMGDLPKERLTLGKPSTICGVDYAGPVTIRLSRGRVRRTEKGYICLFVYLVTRAIHMELVTDASTPTFLAAFKRFVARRGHCHQLYSDRGTNFVEAARQLRSSFYMAKEQLTDLAAVLANQGTEWKFNPPGAPHFGGLWEAGVKALKYHLRRIISNQVLTYEEFWTLLVQIES
ncbi:hypothetical protein LAZ67_16002037 [Cordylochernes scorpioides]|uniref:Integrase catalytic domain-containing protein n=1 Tax=Cordylochernes scorpioides TaxID=51811 RepID=A0ABY6LEC5_9ARAC|nr:hypothetical protein LAZ67_16002037 [Cordylochernes scorpioides]